MVYKPWQPAEDQFIVDNSESMNRGEMAKYLERPLKSVYCRITRLRETGILPPKQENRGRKRKPAEGEELDMEEAIASLDPMLRKMISVDLSDRQWVLIAANHKRMPRRELARMVGISKLQLNQALMSRGYETISAEV